MLSGNGASELSKPDRRDLRVLVEVLLQELQPMPQGLRDFVQRHIWPSFGGCPNHVQMLCCKASSADI